MKIAKANKITKLEKFSNKLISVLRISFIVSFSYSKASL